MTEPVKASEKLSRELSEAVNKIIAEIKSLKTLTPPEHTAMPQAQIGHKTVDEVADCPNCRPKLIEKLRPEIEKELRPAIAREIKEKLKSKELLTCDGCGEIVEKTSESCPTCHGTHAH